jgi:hypothetical protein
MIKGTFKNTPIIKRFGNEKKDENKMKQKWHGVNIKNTTN